MSRPLDRMRGRELRRYAELVHDVADGARPPIQLGSWVVVADPDNSKPLELARVVDGPTYIHRDGHAIGEVWTLHDQQQRHHLELTRIDLGEVIQDGNRMLMDLRRARRSPEGQIAGLRMHRAACLARRVSAPPWCNDPLITALIVLDQLVSDAEDALREMWRVRIPNALRVLWLAGLCELARDPTWQSGDAARPHPRWPL